MSPPTVAELTDPLLGVYTAVPQVGPQVCSLCRRPTDLAPLCNSCELTTGQVANPTQLVVPISMYSRIDSQYGHYLRQYKRSTDKATRSLSTTILAATLARFLGAHAPCIRRAAGADWDTIVPIPSSRTPHPLEAVIRQAPEVDDPLDILVPTRTPPSKRQATDAGYRLARRVRGRSILLIDDTFTTGAHIQSAASILTARGAQVVGAVVLGRVVDLDFKPDVARPIWTSLRSGGFDFDTCCVH